MRPILFSISFNLLDRAIYGWNFCWTGWLSCGIFNFFKFPDLFTVLCYLWRIFLLAKKNYESFLQENLDNSHIWEITVCFFSQCITTSNKKSWKSSTRWPNQSFSIKMWFFISFRCYIWMKVIFIAVERMLFPIASVLISTFLDFPLSSLFSFRFNF